MDEVPDIPNGGGLDSIVLPNGDIVHKVYSFNLQHEGYHVMVGFLHFGEYKRSEADPAFESELRQNFGQTVLAQPAAPARNMWLELPQHEYLDKLTQNGFNYAYYNICTLEAAKRKFISVKPADNEGPLLRSQIQFPRK